jgi:hypothetical protein
MNAASSESQIPHAVNSVRARIEELEKLSTVLTERLCQVLRPRAPTPPAGKPALNQPKESQAPLAVVLDEFAGRLGEVCRNLDAVLNAAEC